MHGAFDLRCDVDLAVKIARAKNRLQQGRDVVVALAQPPSKLRLKLGRDLLAHEEAIELASDERGAGGVLEDQIDDLFPIEMARGAENGLLVVIVLRGAFNEV